MPSMIVAAGLMALSGMASAFPQGGFSNGTAPATSANSTSVAGPLSTGTSGSDPVTESRFCPTLSGSVVQSKTGTSQFLLQCGTNYFGVVIDVQANSTSFINKRQQAVAPANIQDCLAACDGVTSCVGTAFNTAARTCTLYSQVGASFAAAGIDFAVRVSVDTPITQTAGQVVTSTVYAPSVSTIYSCAPTVTNCPLTAGPVVVTNLVPVSATTYVCPAVTTVPVAPVACNCAYGVSTAVIYSVNSVGSAVAVKTQVIAVPSGNGASYAVTTVTGAAVTTAPTTVAVKTGASTTGGANGGSGSGSGSGSATTTGGVAKFTGAASNVKAGMGLVAGVAGLAFML